MDASLLEEFSWVGAAVAAWLIVEIIKFFARSRAQGFGEKEQQAFWELYRMHTQQDMSGRPLWYVDPALVERQKKVMDILEALSNTVHSQKHSIRHIDEDLQHLHNVNEALKSDLISLVIKVDRILENMRR